MTDAAIIAAMRSEKTDDAELRESLQRFGWVEEFPAIQDERGVTLVGNRRLRIAHELKIKPVIKRVTIGDGEEADAQRLRLALASNLGGKPISREERKTLAIYLYQDRGWVQQRIADGIGMSQSTIRDYLSGLVETTKPPRPKGGRPKAHKYPRAVEDKAATLHLDEGKPIAKVAAELGVSEQVVIKSTAREVGRREVKAEEPTVDRADLSLTAQEKFDAAVRQYKRKLDLEYEVRLRDERLKRDEIWLAGELEQFKDAEKIIDSHRGIMSPAQYKNLQRCLHTDTITGIRERARQKVDDSSTDRHYDTAFHLVTGLKAVLVKEESKAPALDLSPAEMMRRRAEVFAKRSAQSKANAKRKRGDGAVSP